MKKFNSKTLRFLFGDIPNGVRVNKRFKKGSDASYLFGTIKLK
jgi:hypothetical protein